KFNVPDDKKVTEEVFNAKYKVKVSDDLRKAVRHERRVELAGEGLRLYDLLRWGTFVSTMQAFSKTKEGIYSGAGSNVTDKTWPYPIPQAEIDNVGGSLTQNDNY
ncbi:RagB/SusD family nutrient uptake outer membrane protein, partial [Parabacteroides chinchillae]